MDPVYFGDYPSSMKERCGERLPSFTDYEKSLVLGSSDFFGLNHYSTDYVLDATKQPVESESMGKRQSGGYWDDQELSCKSDPAWEKSGMNWDIVPWGLARLLLYIQKTYAPKGGIYITENGCGFDEVSQDDGLQDLRRVRYFQSYIAQLHAALQDGVDVRGYFAWSLMDNFEWQLGYTKRFGIVRVDYTTQERRAKASAKLMQEIAETNVLRLPASVLESSRFSPML